MQAIQDIEVKTDFLEFNDYEMENISDMELESVLKVTSWLEMNVTSNCSDD